MACMLMCLLKVARWNCGTSWDGSGRVCNSYCSRNLEHSKVALTLTHIRVHSHGVLTPCLTAQRTCRMEAHIRNEASIHRTYIHS